VIAAAVLVLLLLAVMASVSYRGRRTFELVGAAAEPIDPVFVAYIYRGGRPNFVHSVSYEASPLTLARSDAGGRVVVPGSWFVHAPFPIKTHPSLWIELVYAPRLHNAWGALNGASPSIPGVFVIDRPGQRATLTDLSDRPEQWEGTLRNLSSIIGRLVAPHVETDARLPISADTAALTLELIRHMHDELAAFVGRYDTVRRTMPEMPPHLRHATAEEQKQWEETTAAHLAREPTWGMLITRLFTDELEYYEQRAAALR
jgi:hypothetical protein